MIPLTAETIARLKTLLEQATPGPWTVRPEPYDEWGIVKAANGYIVAHARTAQLEDWPNGAPPYGTDEWHHGPLEQKANAEFIAEVHNVLPALLASLEAVQAPTCATCQHCEGDDDQGEGVLCVQPEMVGRGYASFYYHAPKDFGCTFHVPLTRPATETT